MLNSAQRTEGPVIFDLSDVEPREAQALYICNNFAAALNRPVSMFFVYFDDLNERIRVFTLSPTDVLLGDEQFSCYVMSIHSDDDEYRFWNDACHLVSFPFLTTL